MCIRDRYVLNHRFSKGGKYMDKRSGRNSSNSSSKRDSTRRTSSTTKRSTTKTPMSTRKISTVSDLSLIHIYIYLLSPWSCIFEFVVKYDGSFTL